MGYGGTIIDEVLVLHIIGITIGGVHRIGVVDGITPITNIGGMITVGVEERVVLVKMSDI